MATVILILAVLALLLVIFEDVIHINKAETTLFIGTLCWLIAYLFPIDAVNAEHTTHQLNENLLEIATLWLFLTAAMTFVAYLNSKGFISNLVQHLLPNSMHERSFMFLIGLFAFLFSSFADNVTSTLVAVAVIVSLDLPPKQRLKYATLIVFAVNSGGVSLITGDVTTLMIFLAGKVSIADLLYLVLPSLTAVMTLAALLSINLKGQLHFSSTPKPIAKNDKIIAAVFLTTILCTLVGNAFFQIPPVLTFLFGLSCMFLIGQYLEHSAHPDVLHYIREIEFETLLFFLGVLLIVGMLKEIGVLTQLTEIYKVLDVSLANYLLGMLSAILDNVPLTAALLKADINMTTSNWLALTYATGVGGSLLIIGSAAGIIAMSKVKELTFMSYLSMGGYLLVAYSLGYWLSFFTAEYALS
ncbi:sodium:proton antiporter NhaD [Thalassotalea euphylliae]|uniref:sodium:proton antiporter NhaD n=1 Tax=Thalassotalea euphylliae TaxID=1655234 RepID=UPI003626ACBA